MLGWALLGLALTEIAPRSMTRRAAVMGEHRGISSRTDFVYRTTAGDVLTVRRLDAAGGRMFGLSLERNGDGRDAELPAVHTFARSAEYDTIRGGWLLRDGFYRVYDGADSEHTYRFAELRDARFTDSPEALLAEPKDEDEMTDEEIGELIETLRRSGADTGRLLVKREAKIAIPVATLIIILFGAPLANSSARSGPAYGIGISLGITIMYMMLFRITGAAGATGTMDPWLAAWLPNLLLIGGAVILLSRVRT
jgi:lipopolysaccharide export LptBFGC system permease protein LptF